MQYTLGKRICQNRKRLQLTQEQLAEQLGVTAQAVSKWENDQSCPDITVIPKLADIFGISTDELLGHTTENVVHEAEIVEESAKNRPRFELQWDNGKKDGIGLAVTVLAVGILYLLSRLLMWDIGFWSILWTTSLLMFGIWGLFPKFSFFHLGCSLVGGYFLADLFIDIPINFDGKLVFALLILLFGLSLLADALRKPKKAKFEFSYSDDKNSHQENVSKKSSYTVDGDRFYCTSSFGENYRAVTMDSLRYGRISNSFGELHIDLTAVASVTADCTIEASCNFGELNLRVPRKYEIKPHSSSSFGGVDVEGAPQEVPEAVIHLDANVSFGAIEIEYI